MPRIGDLPLEIQEIKSLCIRIRENVSKVIVGKDRLIDLMTTALLSGGHVLLEDVPGTGKTMLAKSLAKSLGTDFKRVQFTPDLLPSDLTGINYFNQKINDFIFRQGPVFTNILLADEINRATPRTQSSLLECMEEKQITIDGTTYRLSEPYFVIATQNPVETQGTFPLPEAQLDRFLIKSEIGYPTANETEEILEKFQRANPFDEITPVCTAEEITEAANSCRNVYISDDMRKYIIEIMEKTRIHPSVELGVSPRGAIALLRACQSFAALNGRSFIIPEDVKHLVPYVFGHRLILKNDYRIRRMKPESVIEGIINEVKAPTENWEK
ncbi:MAG TPA: MoxR family ATPase [Clostridia bacterium]|nr:MoxR family ATPase [Clostridia bacterium]